MSVAIVHDYLTGYGGAERVVAQMAQIWPQATIYSSLYRPESTFEVFRRRSVCTSPLQRLPVDRGYRSLLPLYPLAFRSLGALQEDLVISSSSGWAHAVRTGPDSLHVVYCHTPARWLYGAEYLGASARQLMLKPVAPALRAWDRAAARRPDLYLANSRTVQERIRRTYGREATVVYPPVEVERFTPTPRGERLLVVCRLLPYKRVDVAVRAAARSKIGLDVVGDGPALRELRRIGGSTVTFHGWLEDGAVAQLMQSARAVCVPGVEDFGIVPVEAQAAGKPVVAFAGGGALESVVEGLTGVFFHSHDPESLLEALRRCDQLETSPAQIAANARRFSVAEFRRRLQEAIASAQRAAPVRSSA